MLLGWSDAVVDPTQTSTSLLRGIVNNHFMSMTKYPLLSSRSVQAHA
jgi:hypothetical protein